MTASLPARVLAGIALALPAVGGCAGSAARERAEECPVCHKPVEDGPEVRVLRAGEVGPGTRYRCFFCPIVAGGNGPTWELRGRSGLDGRWVVFRVDGERVVADPSSAVVLALPVGPGAECLDVHRVFADEGEFRRYVGLHAELAGARPQRFEDVLRERGGERSAVHTPDRATGG